MTRAIVKKMLDRPIDRLDRPTPTCEALEGLFGVRGRSCGELTLWPPENRRHRGNLPI
jgi:hypothetical protein